jgi:CheY-like chemotaxis protein
MNAQLSSHDPWALRRRAEDLLTRRLAASPLSDLEMLRLVHEMQVYQVELELQNQALAQAEAEAVESLSKLEALNEQLEHTVAELALAKPYSLILMDMRMPVMNGLDAVRAIRRDQRGAGVAILMTTANDQLQDRQACADAGASEHLAKPISDERLMEALVRWLPVVPGKPAA